MDLLSWIPFFRRNVSPSVVPATKIIRQSAIPLSTIPSKLLTKIFQKLTSRELLAFKRTCSHARNFIEKHRRTIGIPVKWKPLMYDNGKFFYCSLKSLKREEFEKGFEKNFDGIRLSLAFHVSRISTQEDVDRVVDVFSRIKCKGIVFYDVPQHIIIQILNQIRPYSVAVRGSAFHNEVQYDKNLTVSFGFQKAKIVVLHEVLALDTRFMGVGQHVVINCQNMVELANGILKDFHSGKSTPSSYLVITSIRYYPSFSVENLFKDIPYSLEWAVRSNNQTVLKKIDHFELFLKWKRAPSEVFLYSMSLPNGGILGVGICSTISCRIHLKCFSSREEMFTDFMKYSWELSSRTIL